MTPKFLIPALLVAMTFGAAPVPLEAGAIQRACMQSDRKAASRSLCRCIQDAASETLTSSDQRLAASFFKDPHKSQEIRQSDRGSHEAFWQRYKDFNMHAERKCS